MIKAMLIAVALGASALLPAAAHAHGAAAKHGGVVQASGDLSFEAVAKDGALTIYVEDHGKPVSTADMSGRLTLLSGSEKSEAPLAPAGDNRLRAENVRVAPGTRAVAVLATPQKKTLTVRFVLK
jgi:hypothetical protein